MTKERQICVRPILDKIVSFIYRCVGYIVILAILHEELSAGRSF